MCSVAFNGQSFKARAGDVLLDAALASGVQIPHDCRSGLCGSCVTRIVKGSTIMGETAVPRMVHACRARVLSDLEIETEEVPQAVSVKGVITSLQPLDADVFEVTIMPQSRVRFLPGQYFNFKFDGFPPRSYSATRPLQHRQRPGAISLQVRRHPQGRVSGELGRRIKRGHPVTMAGPYGSAFFREGKSGRLVLISSGTGFAPIWGIACAALRENPGRDILLITGVRSDDAVYMAAGLERLARFPNVAIVVTTGRRPRLSELVREGYPTDHLPNFTENDIVYACGPGQLIDALSPAVVGTGAEYYTDAFEPSAENEEPLWMESAKRLKKLLMPEGGWILPVPFALPGPRPSS